MGNYTPAQQQIIHRGGQDTSTVKGTRTAKVDGSSKNARIGRTGRTHNDHSATHRENKSTSKSEQSQDSSDEQVNTTPAHVEVETTTLPVVTTRSPVHYGFTINVRIKCGTGLGGTKVWPMPPQTP